MYKNVLATGIQIQVANALTCLFVPENRKKNYEKDVQLKDMKIAKLVTLTTFLTKRIECLATV